MSSKFSQDIQALLTKLAAEPMTLREMLQATSDRGVSLIVALLVLPFLFPMPPGLSGIIGGACFCLAMQMAVGKKSFWLPEKIAKFQFPRSFSQQILVKLRYITIRLEKIVRPRWHKIANNSYAKRINACCIVWLSILLMSPIPFTNPPPAIAILMLSIATIEADGLLMWIGYFLTLANTVLFAFIVYALWQAPQFLPKIFSQFIAIAKL
ncbi:MAG: exopolysaccharide biosynthesis protein [Cyanobacteria bacterium P01_A01_bin.83]